MSQKTYVCFFQQLLWDEQYVLDFFPNKKCDRFSEHIHMKNGRSLSGINTEKVSANIYDVLCC